MVVTFMSPSERTVRAKRLATLLRTIAERHIAKQSETLPAAETESASKNVSGGASL